LSACSAQESEPSAEPDCVQDGQGFTGGADVPLQIFGSYGPGQSKAWDVETGKAGGNAQNVQMATGMPNGIVTILWGKNAGAGDNTLTVECTTGWGTYSDDDPTRLWQAGIIFDEIPGLGENTYFCHHIEMDTAADAATMKMWETYWKFGEDYSCPQTLTAALDGDSTAPNPVTYLELPDTGIGADTVPVDQWTTGGSEVGVQTGS
jgi:hypothetical protein